MGKKSLSKVAKKRSKTAHKKSKKSKGKKKGVSINARVVPGAESTWMSGIERKMLKTNIAFSTIPKIHKGFNLSQ